MIFVGDATNALGERAHRREIDFDFADKLLQRDEGGAKRHLQPDERKRLIGCSREDRRQD
jgi:hypothetical protein